jgi:hypothetical protein
MSVLSANSLAVIFHHPFPISQTGASEAMKRDISQASAVVKTGRKRMAIVPVF